MATIQLGTTGSASQLCNYAEKRAREKDGYNLDIDYAKWQMKQTRELFSKNDGIQAHHIIHTFKPYEDTVEEYIATTKQEKPGSASQLYNYAEKRAREKEDYNNDIDYAKSQIKQTRELFSKNDRIQAHHVIQSFKPDEVTPEKANQVGLEL